MILDGCAYSWYRSRSVATSTSPEATLTKGHREHEAGATVFVALAGEDPSCRPSDILRRTIAGPSRPRTDSPDSGLSRKASNGALARGQWTRRYRCAGPPAVGLCWAAVDGTSQPIGFARQPFRHTQCPRRGLGSRADDSSHATSRKRSFPNSASASSSTRSSYSRSELRVDST